MGAGGAAWPGAVCAISPVRGARPGQGPSGFSVRKEKQSISASLGASSMLRLPSSPPGKTLFSPPAPDLAAGRMADGRQVTLSKLRERLRLPGLCLLPGEVLADLRLPSFPASFHLH